MSEQVEMLIEENRTLKGKLHRLRITLKDMREVNLDALNHEKQPEQRAFLESKILIYGKLLEIINGTEDHDA